jgi:hypothetical protein
MDGNKQRRFTVIYIAYDLIDYDFMMRPRLAVLIQESQGKADSQAALNPSQGV